MNFALFVTVLAWAGALAGVAMTGVLIISENYYNRPHSIEKLRDGLRGATRIFPKTHWVIIAIVSIAWLIAFYFG